ncbi:MAG: type VI secretion system lipoprotein TssJ, partial [Mesorhizobium sp.]
ALGFVALIREPGGRNWRTTKSVSPGSKFTINVSLGKGGISA